MDASSNVAEEVPVALVFNGISHAVMLATPHDLTDFATGFALTEGIVGTLREIFDVEVSPSCNGIEIEVTIASSRFAALKERRRNLAGRTGCGLCGTESLDQVFRGEPAVGRTVCVGPEAFARAAIALASHQPLHALTGAMHAAAWIDTDGNVALAREDVGRHNALDKLVGAMMRAGIGASTGFVLITSRASSEMVQKAAVAGIELVAAVSAPTTLAVEVAQRTGVTLVGFVRGSRYTPYTNRQRVLQP